MERLVTVADMAERYGVTRKTACRYIRQMFHYENPLAAPRWAVDEWEESRETMPEGISKDRRINILQRKTTGRVIVPRKRD